MENTVITKIKNIINIRKEYVKSNFPIELRLETIKEIKLLQMIVDEHEERGDYINSTFVANIAEDYYKKSRKAHPYFIKQEYRNKEGDLMFIVKKRG